MDGENKPPEPLDADRASFIQIAAVFHVTPATITNWRKKGCPRNEDETYCVNDIHKWILGKSSRTGLQEDKLRAEIALKQAQTEKMGEKYILREDHERIMNSWASSFKKFWAQAIKKNIVHFCMKEVDQLNVLFEAFGRQLMAQWSDSGTDERTNDKI